MFTSMIIYFDSDRFDKDGVYELYDALHIPEGYILDNGGKVPGIEALVIFLNRMAYPNRLKSHVSTYARAHSTISRCFNTVLDDIYQRYKHKLTDLNHEYADFDKLANMVGKIAPLKNCIGFIDGTVRPMCRPIRDQQLSYNGHKRVHAIKFQSVIFPDGIIATMHGPYEGRRHDSFLLAESKTLENLATIPAMANGDKFCIYGDPAYPIMPQLIPPYRGNLTPQQEQFNKEMSRVRESVEYGFGKIQTYFSFVDFKKNLKLHLMPIGKIYLVAAFLTNCHTCMYGSPMNALLGTQPPTIYEYLM